MLRELRAQKKIRGELGHKHEKTRPHYILHNRSRKETEEEKKRHEFQQFEIEEMEKTQE